MRIAMLSVHSCPVGNLGARDTGGMSVYIRELARQLGKRGHAVDVFTRVHDPRDPQIIELGANARLIHLMAGGIEQINKMDIYPHLPDFTEDLEDFRRWNGMEYDLIFSHYWLSGLVGERLRQSWQVPHITMFHTLGAVKNAIGIGEPEPELRLKAERTLTRDCQRIIVPTEREKDNIISYYGASAEKIEVIPCGINLERFQPIDKQKARRELGLNNDRIALFVGRLDPLKGVDKLLRAMSLLDSTRKARLMLIGGDKNSQREMEQLQALAQELEIQDSISFLGLIKHEELPYYYSAADVCVIPSHYESFGLVALEALACGTPVIASDVGSLAEIIVPGKTGYIVEDIPERLAEKIAAFLFRPKPDGEQIRASISRYSWENITEAIIQEFQSVLAEHYVPVS